MAVAHPVNQSHEIDRIDVRLMMEERSGIHNDWVVDDDSRSVLLLPASSSVSAELHQFVDSAVESIDGATLAGLALDVPLDSGNMQQIVIDSSETVAPLHVVDTRDSDGPAATARLSGEVVRISSTADEGPWEAFRDACRAIGIMSTASFPISIGDERVGTLTVFSPDYHAFDVEAIRGGRRIAAGIADAIQAADPAWYCPAVAAIY